MGQFDLLDAEEAAPVGAVPSPSKNRFDLLDAPVDPRFVDDTPDSRPLKNTGADFVGQMRAEVEAEKSRVDSQPGIADRIAETAGGLANTFAGGARAVGGAVDRGVLNTLADPHHRREFERGLSDMITLGYAEKLANRVDPGYAKTAQGDAEAAPDDRALGRTVGMFSPGAGSAIAKVGGKVAGAALGDVVAATRAGTAAVGAAKGVAAYEATAPLTAALSTDAEGDRLGAAYRAATDPLGLAVSAAGGAVAKPVTKDLVEKAPARATKDIAHDIIQAEGPKARATDAQRIAEINDRIFQLTKENPSLRSVWREPAETALPKLAKVKTGVAGPLDKMYEAVDAKTEGGISLGKVVKGFEDAAKEAGKTAMGQPDAARLRAVAKNFVAAYGEDGPPVFNADKIINADGMKAGEMLKILERRPNAPGVAEEIARIREAATEAGGVDWNKKIPTAQFRAEVTGLHKNAEQVMGSIEGTPRHEALEKLYSAGKAIIDEHLDGSGVPARELKQLRKINDQYFLLSRAEAAIESRGVKEANKPGLHIPHTAKQAIGAGGVALPLAYAAMHPHAALPIAASIAATSVAPAVASRLNWKLANLPPGVGEAAIERAGAGVGSGAGRAVAPEISRETGDRELAGLVQRGLRNKFQALGPSPGMVAPGNVDLTNRPDVANADGSHSSVRSMSFQESKDGPEILVPTVSDDGRILSDDEAIEMYRKTGRHLGMFKTPDAATAYADLLHRQQESQMGLSR